MFEFLVSMGLLYSMGFGRVNKKVAYLGENFPHNGKWPLYLHIRIVNKMLAN